MARNPWEEGMGIDERKLIGGKNPTKFDNQQLKT